MKSTIDKGSVVIIKKLTTADVIKVGDVVQYKKEDVTILHRVIEIRVDAIGATTFITKGDDNPLPDFEPVYEGQIIGVAQFAIPYLGLPSVWFRELIYD